VENQRTRAYRFWRLGSLSPSLSLYLLCLPFDAFCGAGRCCAGYLILLFGPLDLSASATNWTWLANPVLFGAWITLALGAKLRSVALGLAALALSLAAFVLAISFLFRREIVMDASGTLHLITGYGVGYWIWLSSIAVCCFGCMATIELAVGYKKAVG